MKDWVEAQLAIIETNMVTADQVFMPYQIVDNGETLYELYLRADRLLPVVEED